MPGYSFRIIVLLVPLLLAFQRCQARANVTMHLGLTYDSSRNCEESPYKVTVCIGHKLDKCRVFGPHLFYVQAACAAYGPKEVIQFEVNKVHEPLRVDATIKATSSDKEFQLHHVTANLTFPRPIDAKTQDLKIILQFQFAYACMTDYFGELCDVYCSSDAKEYHCSSKGAKICNPGYIKDDETGACIYDRCGSMPNYCLNSGQCVNKAQNEDDASDIATMPICICPPSQMGARCEIFRPPRLPTMTPTIRANSKVTSHSPDLAIGETLRRQTKTNSKHEQLPKDEGDSAQALGTMEQPSQGRELWYQVMIVTIISVCLTILAFGVCLVAGCYVVRLKAKSALLRRHQASHLGDLQFVDRGCLNVGGTVGNGSVAGDVGGNGIVPVYLQQCSSLDYNSHILQRPSSVRSYAFFPSPTATTVPPDNAQTSTQQPFVLSNGFNHNSDASASFTVYHSPAKTWEDLGLGCTFKHASPPPSATDDTELHSHDTTLPTVNSPEVYTCRHDAYGYLSGLRNHLVDNLTSVPVMNNMLTFKTSTTLRPTPSQRGSTRSPIVVEDDAVNMRKNYFQTPPAHPLNEFPDLAIK